MRTEHSFVPPVERRTEGGKFAMTTFRTGQRILPIVSDYVPVALLAALAFAFRLNMLTVKDVISADGIGYVTAARSIATGDLSGFASNGFYIFLVWLFGLAAPDFETAGRLVSITFGSLLVVPLYMLGSELFSRTTALAACMVITLWPSLLNWSCEVMTQATYVTLTLTGCYFVWRMCHDESVASGFRAGFCLGLAFLTRTEAALLFLALPVFPLWLKRPHISKLKRVILAYVASFTLLCGLHILMLKIFTGSWQLSAKTSFALNDALSYYLDVPDLNHIPGIKQTGYLDIMTRYPGFVWLNSMENIAKAWSTMLPTPLWILALIGFLKSGFGKETNLRRLFLLSSFSPLAVIVVFYYIAPEYSQPYIPVLLLWCAEGVNMTERTLAGHLPAVVRQHYERITAKAPFVIIAAGIYGITLLVQQIPTRIDMATYSPESDGARRDHKRIGLLLKAHLPPGKIMTRSGRIAYYADRDWVLIPNAGTEEILQTARREGVRFLVLDGTLAVVRPQLMDLFLPLINSAYPKHYFYVCNADESADGLFKLIYRDPTSSGVIVREIIYE